MAPRLPPAPPSVDDGGTPRFGTYEGTLDAVHLKNLRGSYQPNALDKLRMHKKWLYGFLATREVLALWAVVDLGYTSNAFSLALDLTTQRVLADESYLGPPRPFVTVGDHPGPGLEVGFRRPDARLAASRRFGDERFHGSVRLGPSLPFVRPKLAFTWELLAAGAAPPLTVIAPVEGGVVNVTQKWAGLLSFGQLEAGGRRFVLDGGVGGLDYTHGYLARRTSWRWAFVCGRLDDGTPFGINLVEGFNETRDDVNENAVWLGQQLYPVGRARFAWNRSDPLDPWRVSTTDGKVDLTFKPLAAHRDFRDLKLVKSRFEQPVGLWSGTLKLGDSAVRFENAAGVTEDQDVLW
ncbi:MAG: hypothetical protein AMXMBFR34_16550 [Myxococcaceae bacterium]